MGRRRREGENWGPPGAEQLAWSLVFGRTSGVRRHLRKFLALYCARRHPPDLPTRPSARKYVSLLPLWTCFPVFFLSFSVLDLASSGHTPVIQAKASQILIIMKSVLSLVSCVKAYDIPSCGSHWRTVCPWPLNSYCKLKFTMNHPLVFFSLNDLIIFSFPQICYLSLRWTSKHHKQWLVWVFMSHALSYRVPYISSDNLLC